MPVRRLIISSVLLYLFIAALLFLLTVFRMSYMPAAAQVVCGDDPTTMSVCVAELTKLMLFGAQWSAVKFTVYVCLLTPAIYLGFLRARGDVRTNLLALFGVMLLALIATIKPPWVEVVALLTSSVLAGAIIYRRQRKKGFHGH